MMKKIVKWFERTWSNHLIGTALIVAAIIEIKYSGIGVLTFGALILGPVLMFAPNDFIADSEPKEES